MSLNVKKNFRITLIEKKEFYEWVTATPFSVINNTGYFDNQATVDYEQMVNVDKVLGVNVTYLQVELTELVDKNTIKIRRIKGVNLEKNEEELQFDYLTLWSGPNYPLNEKNRRCIRNLQQRREKETIKKIQR